MKIEVTNVGAEVARPRYADKRVEVGSVEVHLSAGVVHRAADIANGFFEHTVGRWVGDH
jgi:predicted metal-dependent enzyme (double-stranded beta helix superfamily)